MNILKAIACLIKINTRQQWFWTWGYRSKFLFVLNFKSELSTKYLFHLCYSLCLFVVCLHTRVMAIHEMLFKIMSLTLQLAPGLVWLWLWLWLWIYLDYGLSKDPSRFYEGILVLVIMAYFNWLHLEIAIEIVLALNACK